MMRQALGLVKQGVPFDVAFALNPEEAIGWTVIFGELDGGGAFDWDTMSWVREN